MDANDLQPHCKYKISVGEFQVCTHPHVDTHSHNKEGIRDKAKVNSPGAFDTSIFIMFALSAG